MFIIKHTVLLGLLALVFGSRSGKTRLSGNHHSSHHKHHTAKPSLSHHRYPVTQKSHSHQSSADVHKASTHHVIHNYPSSTSRYSSSGAKLGHSSGSHTYPSSTVKYSYSVGNNVKGEPLYPAPSSSNSYIKKSGVPLEYSFSSSHGVLTFGTQNHKIHVYKNYYYKPPARVIYIPPQGGTSINYPVYHGEPPAYIYQYNDSGSKYRTLLAGLALMNLGAHSSKQSSNAYKPQIGEVCKFAIERQNGDYEEAIIDCQIISSFILEDMQARKVSGIVNNNNYNVNMNSATVNSQMMLPNGTVMNNDFASLHNTPIATNQFDMLPNDTLVPKGLSGTLGGNPNGPMMPSIITNTPHINNALNVIGKPLKLIPGMQCYVMMLSAAWNMKKPLPCALLQSYAHSSLHVNCATRESATLAAAVILALTFILL